MHSSTVLILGVVVSIWTFWFHLYCLQINLYQANNEELTKFIKSSSSVKFAFKLKEGHFLLYHKHHVCYGAKLIKRT